MAFLFPIMLVEEFVRPLSLTLRLYGNIFGEEKVTESFFHLVPLGIPVIMQLLSILMGAIQALVFALLAGIYISEAAEHGAEEHEKLEAHVQLSVMPNLITIFTFQIWKVEYIK